MNWMLIAVIVYVIIVILVCLRIIYDTRSSTKTAAYLLLAIFLPVIGIALYFSFGINYRKRKLYDRKVLQDEALLADLKKSSALYMEETLPYTDPQIRDNEELARLLIRSERSPLTRRNKVKLLVNGEEKFPEIMDALKKAKHHIHIEYYIFEEGEISKQIEDILVQKAKEGVEVRFIYDDFGSRSIRKKMVPRLKAAGIQTTPFYRILFIVLANRFNYRNHRKIIVIDGHTAFTGGINISDRYINNKPDQLYWRDTHLRIDGPGVFYLQYLFISDWNFCTGQQLKPGDFLRMHEASHSSNTWLQVAASGPDSEQPSILFSLLEAIYLAQEEILITTPYFIPGEGMIEALTIAALSGLKVKLLVPGISDIRLVNAAACSYYDDLLAAGVEIYRYQKGFIHAKSMVADGKLSVVGTANMDYRSFELNFEVNAVIYDKDFSQQLRDIFYEDIKDATKIDPEQWFKRPLMRQIAEKIARLVSPLL